MATILVTGFEPFGGDSRNPSGEVAQALDGHLMLGRDVVGLTLPCVFGESVRLLRGQVRRHRPELVVALGLAGGRDCLSAERVAINLDDARIPDNVGSQPVDEAIVAKGPVAYWSRLPVKAIVQAWRQAGLPGEVSQSAGTYVCNHVFYCLMRMLARTPVRGGFIHLPPTLDMASLRMGVELALRTSLQVHYDLRIPEGALH